MGKSRHIATFALIGAGHRVGTRYLYRNDQIAEALGKPHFRFRNDESKRAWTAWASRRSASPIAACPVVKDSLTTLLPGDRVASAPESPE